MFGFPSRHSQLSNDRYVPDFRSLSERAYVVKAIPEQGFGRIRYQAVEWNACTENGESIPVRTEVMLLNRRGTTWLVSPVD